MNLNLSTVNGKIKVGIGAKEEYPIQISVSREAFAKIVAGCIMGKRPAGDVRDFTEAMWQETSLLPK